MRPCRARRVDAEPPSTIYKPAGVPARLLEWVELALDEFEALRLCDGQGLDQDEAAQLMGISRPTLGRILERARCKVACVLAEGKALQVCGGPVDLRCDRRGHRHGQSGGRCGMHHAQHGHSRHTRGETNGPTDTTTG